MRKPRIAGLGLCAALLGAQPGCAHQMTNRDFAVEAVVIGLVVGSLVLASVTDHCKGPATCSHPSESSDPRLTTRRGTPTDARAHASEPREVEAQVRGGDPLRAADVNGSSRMP